MGMFDAGIVIPHPGYKEICDPTRSLGSSSLMYVEWD